MAIAPTVGQITGVSVTWIDASLGIDSAGTLYATWDTQQPGGDIGWLSDDSRRGFAAYLRTFSIHHGWLNGPIRASTSFGDARVWPGDTIGISVLGGPQARNPRVMLSWGSAPPGTGTSHIWAAVVRP